MICHGPLLAAEAGIVRGREVTGWPEIAGKIRRAKGKWTGMPVERDGLMFTAIGPNDAENLAYVLANFIIGRETLGPAQEISWKKAQQNTPTTEEIINSILKGENPYFSYKHFLSSNMSDYSLMKGTIEDLRDVYDIDELVAADIVQKLTH
jgi:hypothetical protein